jgi:hypothetical protein
VVERQTGIRSQILNHHSDLLGVANDSSGRLLEIPPEKNPALLSPLLTDLRGFMKHLAQIERFVRGLLISAFETAQFLIRAEAQCWSPYDPPQRHVQANH